MVRAINWGKGRDPARRERILALLTELWMRDEMVDMRLGQLINVLIGSSDDLFNIEDTTLERCIQIYIDKLKEREAAR